MSLAEYSRRSLEERMDIVSNSKRYDENMQLPVSSKMALCGKTPVGEDVVTYKDKLLGVVVDVEDVCVTDVVSPSLEEPSNISRAGRTSSFSAETFINPIVNINIDDINDLHFLRNTIWSFTIILQLRQHLHSNSTTVIKPINFYDSDSDSHSDSTKWGDFSSDSD